MKAKVMVLIASSNMSGPMKGVLQLIENIDKNKFELDLYNFQYGDDLPRFAEISEEYNLRTIFLIQRGRNYLSLILQIYSHIIDHEYDIVQTHGFKPTFLVFFVRFFVRFKWICFMHGVTNEDLKVKGYNLLDNVLQLAAHRTILVSEAQRNRVFGGSHTKRVCVLRNAVDEENPMPVSGSVRSVRDIFNLTRECRIIATVGRFSPEKGLDVLVEAFALLVQQVDNVHLMLVGDGQEKQSVQKQAERLGIRNSVHFTGYSKTPGDYIRDIDVFVLTSRSEGIPNAILEAMAMGKPVVATAVGGVTEIIENGISGKLVPPEKPHLLVQPLVDLLNDSNLYRRLSIGGKRRVQKYFSIQERIKSLQKLYDEVLSGG